MLMPVMKRDGDCSHDCHPDESRDPALGHVDLAWIPASAGMTVYDRSECLVRGIRPRMPRQERQAQRGPDLRTKRNSANYVYDDESLKDQPKFRKEEPYVKKLIFVTLLSTFVWLGLAGCNDDCPTCPTEDISRYSGYAYVSMISPPYGVYVIDIAADSVVDSLVDELIFPLSALNVDVSPDGKYLVALNNEFTLTLFDMPEFRVVAQRKINGESYFVGWKNQLLQRGSEGFSLYSLPDLEPIITRNPPIGSGSIWLDEATNSFLTSAYPDSLVTVDLDSLTVTQSWRIVDPDGFGFHIYKFCWDKKLGMTYLIIGSIDGASFLVFDLNNSTIVSKTKLYAPFGDLRVNPNGEEVYVTDPGYVNSPVYPGNIFVFDARTGALLDLISLYGIRPDFPFEGMGAWDIEITPDGKDLILGLGHVLIQPANVARVNISKRKVEKLYFEHFDHQASDIVIGPKPK
jgi:hypothetical protein